VQASFKLLFRR